MQDIFDRMQKIISDQFSVDPDEITSETSLSRTWAPTPLTWWSWS